MVGSKGCRGVREAQGLGNKGGSADLIFVAVWMRI